MFLWLVLTLSIFTSPITATLPVTKDCIVLQMFFNAFLNNLLYHFTRTVLGESSRIWPRLKRDRRRDGRSPFGPLGQLAKREQPGTGNEEERRRDDLYSNRITSVTPGGLIWTAPNTLTNKVSGISIAGVTGGSQELTLLEAKVSLTRKEWQKHPIVTGPGALHILGIDFLQNSYYKAPSGVRWAFGIVAVETEGIKKFNTLPGLLENPSAIVLLKAEEQCIELLPVQWCTSGSTGRIKMQ
ncbi:hypothetical protein DUI87_32203 [Hirundo rustica rustica]|uniref:Uncharacterized protein n=1 Tax=Hirundo rustica rustica TaxID=333673 RepID=A0A3M0ISB2_HIRRU|nr:hypothetical protein DUI87_32203 [Hirundo rustica rustica]